MHRLPNHSYPERSGRPRRVPYARRPVKDILDRAFNERYGVPAFNIVNDLTMEAVLSAAEDAHSPVIVQTSVKTVKSIGIDVLYAMWVEMTRHIKVPAAFTWTTARNER